MNCTSNSPKIIWNNSTQKFTPQTSEIGGVWSILLTCVLAGYPDVPQNVTTYDLTVVADTGCSAGNTMVEPTLPQLNINRLTPPTYIDAFKDSFSVTSITNTCGPRTCSSGNNPNVIWD